MSDNSRYSDIIAKLDRAGKHLNDVDACWIAARDVNESEVASECDAQTGDITYYIAKLTPIPVEIPLMIGDALQNFRSALDHLVHALVIRHGGGLSTRTGFLITDSLERYEKESLTSLKGIHELAAHCISSFRPYKTGNESLWILHRLNNIDKHRLLLTTVMVPTGQTLLAPEREFLRTAFRLKYPGAPDPTWLDAAVFGLGPTADNSPRILNGGYKLLTVPAAQAQHTVKFSADIAFGEPGIAESRTVFWVLRTIQSEVRIIIDSLAMYL